MEGLLPNKCEGLLEMMLCLPVMWSAMSGHVLFSFKQRDNALQ